MGAHNYCTQEMVIHYISLHIYTHIMIYNVIYHIYIIYHLYCYTLHMCVIHYILYIHYISFVLLYNQAQLMGAHNYCSQEMVNLLLVGRAVGNVFDGDKDLDGTILQVCMHVGCVCLCVVCVCVCVCVYIYVYLIYCIYVYYI